MNVCVSDCFLPCIFKRVIRACVVLINYYLEMETLLTSRKIFFFCFSNEENDAERGERVGTGLGRRKRNTRRTKTHIKNDSMLKH